MNGPVILGIAGLFVGVGAAVKDTYDAKVSDGGGAYEPKHWRWRSVAATPALYGVVLGASMQAVALLWQGTR